MAIAKRKKRFFNVEIPLIKKETQVIAYDLKEIEGKYIKYDLTRLLRGKNIIVSLKIIIEGDKATTVPMEISLLSQYIRRMIRKGTNYVEDSFSAVTKDSQIRIKPFLITRRKVSRAIRKALRNEAKKELIEYAKTKTTETIFEDVLKNKTQKDLSLKLKKIYPLALCEIRTLKVEKEVENKESQKPEEKE